MSERAFIILGAGRPFQGDEPSALRCAFGNSRVLDWILNSVSLLQPRPQIFFVGGYQVEAVTERYPDFHYIMNTEWQTTRAAFSFLLTPFADFQECLVSYADILFRGDLIEEMVSAEADVVVAVDSCWRKRYSGRSAETLQACEKVFFHENGLTRLGADEDAAYANAEFLGCVLLRSNALRFLKEQKDYLSRCMRTASLSDLIEYLRVRGFRVRGVDVCGDWAELDAPQDLAHFILGTKAQTLKRLQGMVTLSRIEDQVCFTVGQWREDSAALLSQIRQQFCDTRLVVRSSALIEDGFAGSHAGAFRSVLNVMGSSDTAVRQALEEVISSYPCSNPDNQVLIQPMLVDVIASGVVFTRTLTCGAPYYIVNYDDTTGSTESITGGGDCKHATLVIRRDADELHPGIPEKFRPLLPAVREIESLLGYDSLDMEFAITRSGFYILQVRPIAVDTAAVSVPDRDLIALVDEAEKTFDRLQGSSPFLRGRRTILGVMPDWNPAEIIGTKPGRLALSLYRFLIMDEVWAAQRAEYGYRDVRPQPLMVALAGHPYVDVRASFNSFVPGSVDDALAGRLVDFYLDWLESHPHLHDKVEFDVVPTCYACDFSRWEKRLTQDGGFSLQEVESIRTALQEITFNAFERTAQDMDALHTLEERYAVLINKDIPPLEKACLLLRDCRRFGTLPFAHLARSAFIAVTILKSAVHCGALSQDEVDDFLHSIRTVSHAIIDDASKTAAGEMAWADFVAIYGHLRPGTYDITSPHYASDPDYYLQPFVARAEKKHVGEFCAGRVWTAARPRFAAALHASGFVHGVDCIEEFMRRAIEGREYAKFVFTRNLSAALVQFGALGDALGLDPSALSHISIDDFFAAQAGSTSMLDLSAWLRCRSDEGKRMHTYSVATELPALICHSQDFTAFVYPSTQANFIGRTRVVARCVDLSLHERSADFTGAIALIPQADPGYDWLFGRKIAGLITMYGGANSHMAIRAAEFALPAAIGIGEVIFRQVSRASLVEIDPVNRQLKVVA
jgi:choline kinase